MNIGSNIRNFRHTKNLSQAELSKITGIPQTTISDVERNKYKPKVDLCIKIAKALEVEITELIG